MGRSERNREKNIGRSVWIIEKKMGRIERNREKKDN